MRENKGKSLIALPEDYIVIDTETTGLDYDYCNLIEVSAIRYSGGVRQDTFSSLIQPPMTHSYDPDSDTWVDEYVDAFITDLTGITNEMLAGAPRPAQVIPSFMEFIGDAVLIGHNANFDINFLYDAADACGLALRNDFVDTLRIARKVFPELKHHRLADIAEACGVSADGAHRAEADCIATATCYEIMRSNILSRGTEEDFCRLFKQKSARYHQSLANITANTDEIDETNPIFGKIVVFTGALSSMGRKEAFQIVANLGGTPKDSVAKTTNYLVIGSADFAQSVKGGKTTKMKKAEGFQKAGCEICVISEGAFFDLISDYT